MQKLKVTLAMASALAVSGCATTGGTYSVAGYNDAEARYFCERHPIVCVAAGVLVVGAGVAIIASQDNDPTVTVAPVGVP